jgi:putative flavoprotein involved in K+ transport
LLHKAAPLIRVRKKDMAALGVERVARITGVRDGLPVLADGGVLAPANVIWCTGFHPGFSWMDPADLPAFGGDGDPIHDSGVVDAVPGLFFVGLHFLHAMSSAMIHGVGRDAKRIAAAVAARASS